MNEPFVFAETGSLETVAEGVQRRVLAYGEALMAVEVHFEAHAVGALHSHPHTQLTYVLDGEFEFEIDGVKQVVKKGDTLFKLPHKVHGCTCLKKGILLDVFTPYRDEFVK